MQYTFVAAALAATVTASNLVSQYSHNGTVDLSQPHVKIFNRCPYKVYLWSIDKQLGCPGGSGFELSSNDGNYYDRLYYENFQPGTQGGISIKMSKFAQCGGKDITQLEYKIDTSASYKGNYLDMSFVDCTGDLENCPGRTDGFYLKSGTDDGVYASAVNNEHCPKFSVNNAEEAAAVSYIGWADRQTKYCSADANLELYLCGGEDGSKDAPPAPKPSPKPSPSSSSQPSPSPSPSSSSSSSSSEAASSSSSEEAVVAAAAITDAPSAPAAIVMNVKTQTVYVTEIVDLKRHAHGRRHQHFHA